MRDIDYIVRHLAPHGGNREAYAAAVASFTQGSKVSMAEMDAAIARSLGLSVFTAMETEDADCPAYSLETWAMAAIDGKTYRRNRGPDVRFAFPMPPVKVLEVRPAFQPNADFLADQRRYAPDMDPVLLSDSNWQFKGGFDLYIYPNPRARLFRYRGFYAGYGFSLWTDGPQDITDQVAATLWRVHHDHLKAFAGLPWCGCCRRPLTDATSRALGIGPDCARLLGIPHSKAPARAAKIAAFQAEGRANG